MSTASYTLSGLRTGAKYEIRIAAFTVVGIGPESHEEIFTCKNCSIHVAEILCQRLQLVPGHGAGVRNSHST